MEVAMREEDGFLFLMLNGLSIVQKVSDYDVDAIDPPSIFSTAPVVKELASLAKYNAALQPRPDVLPYLREDVLMIHGWHQTMHR